MASRHHTTHPLLDMITGQKITVHRGYGKTDEDFYDKVIISLEQAFPDDSHVVFVAIDPSKNIFAYPKPPLFSYQSNSWNCEHNLVGELVFIGACAEIPGYYDKGVLAITANELRNVIVALKAQALIGKEIEDSYGSTKTLYR